MNETLNEKIDIIKEIKEFLVGEGLTSEEAVHAILDADIIPIFEWECQNNCVRSVEEYAAEAYTFWKAQ